MAVKKKFPYRSAFVACNGGCHVTEGSSCSYGCIACGKCVESCKFGAIHLNEYGVAEVDEEKCIACGRCTRECPQHIIHLHDCANTIAVKCSNKDKGKDASVCRTFQIPETEVSVPSAVSAAASAKRPVLPVPST